MYSIDLAFVHHAGFGEIAERTAADIVRLLRRCGIRSGRVVEFGCGSGITAAALTKRGYDVNGFDLSPAMIRLARANAPGAAFRVGSLMSTTIPPCRAVIAVGEVVTYVAGGLASLARFFDRAFAALPSGGCLLFDFLESAAERTYVMKTAGGRGWSMVSSATLDRSGRLLTRRMAIVRRIGTKQRGSTETHRVRIYPRAEMRAALEEAGFAVRMGRSYGRYRLPPGDVVAMAVKRAVSSSP